ncbi:MAG: B12-binding domain-containing radical SAM protein [Candidatus Lokiarchaeota archaeon]|nr:B12-binding domain-containing radical SAM protein [Candidatus Lokiarchaeota archaeon]
MRTGGYPIVLTAPDTDFTDFFNNPIWPFFFFSVSKHAFGGLFHMFMKNRMQEVLPDGQARLAPYGLRKMEAALVESGIAEEDIVTVHPRFLKRFVGPNTKVVGVSAMNTNGVTYCDQTFTAIIGFGSDSYNSYRFRSLMLDKSVHPPSAKVILGGAGAWQVRNEYCRDRFGIDTVVLGEGEVVFPRLVRDVLEGKQPPPVVTGEPLADAGRIPCIRRASIYGNVEISRGCGRACQFCSPTKRLRRDIPLSTIEREVKLNMRQRRHVPAPDDDVRVFTPMGSHHKGELARQQERMIFLSTEDIMLYRCKDPKFMPNTEAILELLGLLVRLGVHTIQPAHIALAPVVASPGTLAKMSEAIRFADGPLEGEVRGYVNYKKHKYVGVETGLETGSPRIIGKYMRGKCIPFVPEEWPDVAVQAFGILNDNYWFPFASLMVGMPDETDDDALKTLEMLDRLKGARLFYAPMCFTALGDTTLRKSRSADLKGLSDLQKDIFVKCWRHNAHAFMYQIEGTPGQLLLAYQGALLYNLYYRWRGDKKFYEKLFKNVTMFPGT